MSGLFITFEGPEGSGKSTQIRLLAERLQAQGLGVHTTREPGGTPIGDAIRAILLHMDHTEMSPRTETLLFSAARAQIVDQIIRPALALGHVVLCDRYADSTLAYQGYGHGQDLAQLDQLTTYATAGLLPALTLYLDLEPEIGLNRKRTGADEEWNRMEAKTLRFHRTVRQGYLQLAQTHADRWLVIPADQTIQEIHDQIWQYVAQHHLLAGVGESR